MNRVARNFGHVTELDLAQLTGLASPREFAAVGATIITLAGVRLCWGAPRYQMSVEERAKDGVFTEEQARRKIRMMRVLGPLVTIAGCALLTGMMLG